MSASGGNMLVARRRSGDRVEAARDLPAEDYSCPLCAGGVILKRGRVKVAHFAHAPGAACDWAGESVGHLLAKRLLADCFRALGYTVELEEPHTDVGRRVDVAVTVPAGYRVAVEVQDSAISVEEMKRRNHGDRRSGFFATVWVFTSRCAARLLAAKGDNEVRVPNEMLWVQNRYGHGVFVVEEGAGRLWRCDLGEVVRSGESHEWYSEGGELNSVAYSDRTLKSTKTVSRTEVGFMIISRAARYHKPGSPDWTAVFTVS